MTLRAPIAFFAFAFVSGCASAPHSPPAAAVPQTFSEAAFAEHECIGRLKDSLAALAAPRMDSFFSAALNGLLRCEATSGLAHVPTRDINGWLAHANGKPVATKIPPAPRMLGNVPRDDAARLPYQRACDAYLRRYLPASIARAGDDADVAAAFAFNALEECDNTAGFATIEPNELATMMQSKHLL